MTQEKWGQLRNKLLKAVGRNNFTTWIEPLEFQELKGGVAVFSVPTNFMGNYVSQNFADLILYELNTAGESVQRLAFRVAANSPARPAGAAQPVEDQPEPVNIELAPEGNGTNEALESLQAAPLDVRFTFDTFVVGKPNELAHAAARRVSEGGPVTFNPLVLYGGVGLGKTHLMHAIAWELQTKQPRVERALPFGRTVHVPLCAGSARPQDDGLQRAVPLGRCAHGGRCAVHRRQGFSTQEEFFHTFNALVDQNKQIVISADRAPGEIKDLEDRIKSPPAMRPCGGLCTRPITNYASAFFRTKVDQYRQDQYPDLQIADGILEFLAHRISTNVRVLEGALTRLFAFASLVGREIDDGTDPGLSVRCSARLGAQDFRRGDPAQSGRAIINIRLSDMIGPKRVRTYARPRQIAMYLCKQLTSRSLPEIGRRFRRARSHHRHAWRSNGSKS